MHQRILSVLVAAACLASTARADEPKAAISMLGTEAGQVRDDNALQMKLVWCPPGAFVMGCIGIGDAGNQPEETRRVIAGQEMRFVADQRHREVSPVRVVCTRGYWLGTYEVTQAEWLVVMGDQPWREVPPVAPIAAEGDDVPASNISWDDALEFCQRLTDQERAAGRLPDGWMYTLPTEAQWERACRAMTGTRFSFGNDPLRLDAHGRFCENALDVGEPCSHRVGQKKPNPWGLHDMHGNVWEWCRDSYIDTLPGGRDPEVTKSPSLSKHVNRGGSWMYRAGSCDSSSRTGRSASTSAKDVGFRVALTLVRPAADNPAK